LRKDLHEEANPNEVETDESPQNVPHKALYDFKLSDAMYCNEKE
jgi:hypothetical protein